MKHFLAAMTCILVGWCTLFGQCNNFNGGADKYCIENLSITYRDNKFVISGYEVNPNFVLPINSEVPAIAIFIETGDGKYISVRLTPSVNGDTSVFYNYPAMNRDYIFGADATKNYDGGGPRRVSLSPQTANQDQLATSGDNPYEMPVPIQFTVSAFPRDIVQDDSITLVIQPDPFHLQNLYFHYDTRLVNDPSYESNFQKLSTSLSGFYKLQKFSVSDYDSANAVKIAFIRIKPIASFVASIPMNTNAPSFYITTDGRVSNALATTTLKVLASHDPNSMSLYFCDYCPQHTCKHVSRHKTRNEPITFHYVVDFENAGTNNEDSVVVTYFCRTQNLQETVTISEPVFAGKPYTLKPPHDGLRRLNVGEMNEGLHAKEPVGSAVVPFKGELRGTNKLPYGDPATRGSVNFTLQSKKKFKDLSPNDKITAWAEITFVSAKETIKTNEINTTRKDFAKYYNKRCICQNTFVLFRWVCKLFRGI